MQGWIRGAAVPKPSWLLLDCLCVCMPVPCICPECGRCFSPLSIMRGGRERERESLQLWGVCALCCPVWYFVLCLAKEVVSCKRNAMQATEPAGMICYAVPVS
jgi:hypothetical protein